MCDAGALTLPDGLFGDGAALLELGVASVCCIPPTRLTASLSELGDGKVVPRGLIVSNLCWQLSRSAFRSVVNSGIKTSVDEVTIFEIDSRTLLTSVPKTSMALAMRSSM